MNRALPSPSNVLFRHLRHGALALCLPLALSAPGLALAQTDVKSTPDANESETAKAPVTEQAFPQRGNVTVAGKRIDYTVTPGTLTIRNDEGEPIASMFYVGYVAAPAHRPCGCISAPSARCAWILPPTKSARRPRSISVKTPTA